MEMVVETWSTALNNEQNNMNKNENNYTGLDIFPGLNDIAQILRTLAANTHGPQSRGPSNRTNLFFEFMTRRKSVLHVAQPLFPPTGG